MIVFPIGMIDIGGRITVRVDVMLHTLLYNELKEYEKDMNIHWYYPTSRLYKNYPMKYTDAYNFKNIYFDTWSEGEFLVEVLDFFRAREPRYYWSK